jgi:hypothetical protein
VTTDAAELVQAGFVIVAEIRGISLRQRHASRGDSLELPRFLAGRDRAPVERIRVGVEIHAPSRQVEAGSTPRLSHAGECIIIPEAASGTIKASSGARELARIFGNLSRKFAVHSSWGL